MKRLFLTIILSVITYCALAQYNKIDSLKRLLATTKNDTAAILIRAKIAHSYFSYKPDSCLLLAESALNDAKRMHYLEGEGRCYKEIGDAYEQMGNYPGAMNAYLRHLKIAEQLNKEFEIALAYANIGLIYQDQDEFKQAISYTLKAKTLIEKLDNKAQIKTYELNHLEILLNLGYYYYKVNALDPALLYEQQAYQLSLQIRNDDNLGNILQNLGLIQQRYNNKVLALTYFWMSAKISSAQNDYGTLTDTYLRMGDFYKAVNLTDSVTFYGKQALSNATKSSYTKGILEASTMLAEAYSGSDKSQAYDYLKIATVARDKLFNQEKVKEVQNLKFEEEQREQSVEELKLQQEEERKDNLQLSAIALFIPIFFLLLIFLSKVKVHHRIIESMSIMSILFLFEFVTLLLHSAVGNLANHVPVLEFASFVIIAAIMIPLHHKFNHWLIKRLTNLHKWSIHLHTPVSVDEAPKTVE